MILAELLSHDAANSEATGEDSDALLDYLHAFCLLSDSIGTLSAEDKAVYRPKLEALARHLRSLPADPYVSEKLLQYDDAKTPNRAWRQAMAGVKGSRWHLKGSNSPRTAFLQAAFSAS